MLAPSYSFFPFHSSARFVRGRRVGYKIYGTAVPWNDKLARGLPISVAHARCIGKYRAPIFFRERFVGDVSIRGRNSSQRQ